VESRARFRAVVAGVAAIALLAVPAQAEVVQENGLIVSFGGSISPRALPRSGVAPIGVTVAGRVRRADGKLPPALRRLSLEINSSGILDTRGLPTCSAAWIEPASSRDALASCGRAQVGGGQVTGRIAFPDQRPFSFTGIVLAFNARAVGGGPAILAHVYSKVPFALAFVLTFSVDRTPGTYGTRLVAIVPPRTRRLVHITSFRLHLGRTYEYAGRRHSYLSAGCPAPAGFPGATLPLARGSYSFVGGTTLRKAIVRTCRARS
jgi:hypothetical protein